jgi:CRISPR/Cas system-associated exonuclease Cas4 (RecB family)
MNSQNQTIETVEVKVERRGRPVLEGSARQIRLAKMEEKKAKGIEIKRGRPTDTSSARQQRLALRQEKIEQGKEVKRGRPKMIKEEEVKVNNVEVTVKAEQEEISLADDIKALIQG